MSVVTNFLLAVQQTLANDDATEHSYRPALKTLFEAVDPNVTAQNEPKRLTDVGAPDFSFKRTDIVIGHAEAKDLHIGIRTMKDANKDLFAPGPVNSPSRITLEYNGKIRPLTEMENSFSRASGGDEVLRTKSLNHCISCILFLSKI